MAKKETNAVETWLSYEDMMEAKKKEEEKKKAENARAEREKANKAIRDFVNDKKSC